jgi:hypothetical protein
LELHEVRKISFNFFNGQVNEHSSDLGGFVFSGNLLYELIDELSYLSLIVGIVRNNCWH